MIVKKILEVHQHFSRLKNTNLRLNRSISRSVSKKEAKVLGHVMSPEPEKIQAKSEKICAYAEWSPL